jgi:hypothetical protein
MTQNPFTKVAEEYQRQREAIYRQGWTDACHLIVLEARRIYEQAPPCEDPLYPDGWRNACTTIADAIKDRIVKGCQGSQS